MGKRMVLEAETTISTSTATVKGKKYRRLYLYLPTILTNDSAFPFKEGDKVKVRIEGKRLVVEKV